MSEFKSSDCPVTHLSLTITSSQIKFEGLEQLRIAKLRNQQRRQPKQSEVLIGPAVAPRKNRRPRPEPRKSKRIGKVVIKLRNGKKLVVKKKRKQTAGQRSKTTQRPVLVTTKAVSPPKPRLSFPSSVSLPPIRVSTPPPAPAPAPRPAQKTENIFQSFNSIPIGTRYCVVKS